MNPIDAALRIGLTLVVTYFWTDNLLRAYRDWHHDRDAESLRAFLIGFVIEMGMFTFLSSALAAWLVEFVVLSRLFAFMTTGALLVVGIWTWLLWRWR